MQEQAGTGAGAGDQEDGEKGGGNVGCVLGRGVGGGGVVV